jgi:hypothetical protein
MSKPSVIKSFVVAGLLACIGLGATAPARAAARIPLNYTVMR